MIRPSVLVAAGLLSILLAARAAAAEPAAVTEQSPATVAAPGAPVAEIEPKLAAQRLSPMMLEILAAIDSQRAKIAALNAERTKRGAALRSLELERALSAAKRETEVRLLQIQAGYARREGRLEAAAHLEAAIAAMSAPGVSSAAVARPVPAAESGR